MKCMMALCALAVASPTIASDNPFAKERVVISYDDLNLNTVAGQRSLDKRLDHAAAAVCGEGMARIHLSLETRSGTCRSEVVASYRAQIAARRDKEVRLAGLSRRVIPKVVQSRRYNYLRGGSREFGQRG